MARLYFLIYYKNVGFVPRWVLIPYDELPVEEIQELETLKAMSDAEIVTCGISIDNSYVMHPTFDISNVELRRIHYKYRLIADNSSITTSLLFDYDSEDEGSENNIPTWFRNIIYKSGCKSYENVKNEVKDSIISSICII